MRSNQLIAIFGTRGSGKTTLAKYISSGFKNAFAYDSMGEYSHLPRVSVARPFPAHFNAFCKKALEVQNLFLVVDEADRVVPQNEGNALVKNFPSIYDLIHVGRHRNVGGVFISRRAANMHKDLLSQCDYVYCFRQFLPNDIDYLRGVIGNEAADRMQSLAPYHFIEFHEGVVRSFAPVPRL